MNDRLLINFATRGRRKQFFAAMDNIQQTIGSGNYEIVVSCDTDDFEMNNSRVRERIKQYKHTTIYFDKSVSKVHAINRVVKYAGEWHWLMNMSDDMRFVINGWHDKMLKDIRSVWLEGSDWFAHFNDYHVREKLPTMSVMGYDYYTRDGYVYHPSYGSVSCDAEAMFVAMMRGRHHYFPTVYFHHNHPANIRGHIDNVYKGNHRFGHSDTENYFIRRARLFDIENPVMIPYNPNERV